MNDFDPDNTSMRPRHYFDRISKLTTPEERIKAFQDVPEMYKKTVNIYLTNMFDIAASEERVRNAGKLSLGKGGRSTKLRAHYRAKRR